MLTIAANPAWAGVAQVAAPSAAGQAAQQPQAKARAQSPHGETVVTFAWGGGLAGQMPTLPIFKAYGMHATYFVPSGLVCTESAAQCAASSPYLTLSDIHKIASYGNEIGGLSVLHRDLTQMPAAEAQREICNDRMNLFRWGFRPTDFAYPFAAQNPEIGQITRQCGYNAGLGAGELRGAGGCNACALAETIPPQNPMLVRAPEEVNATQRVWTVGTYQNIVNDVRQHGGGWIFFTIHDVCSKYCAYGITPPELRQVLGWLRSQRGNNVKVETMRQVIGGRVHPAVPGPAARPVAAPGVINSTLSSTTGRLTKTPLCFQQAHYGQNDARFNYSPTGGPNGEGAVTVHITRWDSGGAYFLPEMDLGQCAPRVSPGRQYTVGAMYKSSHPTQLALYYRNQIGNWLYWTTSPAFPAASSWKKASWTTPAVPADATAVSFGLTAAANMTLTSTAYNMSPAKSPRALILLGLLLFALVATALIVRGQLRYRRHIREEIAAEERHSAVA